MSQASKTVQDAGSVYVAQAITAGVETITGAGSTNTMSPLVPVSVLVASGTSTLSLGVAPAGTVKYITCKSGSSNMTLTAANGNVNVATSIVFNAAGEAVTLVSDGTKWNVAGVNGATIS